MGLVRAKVPEEQPNQIQLIVLDTKESRILASFLVYDSQYVAPGRVDPGHFLSDPAHPTGYRQPLHLPQGWEREPEDAELEEPKTDIHPFLREYRKALAGLYSRWDLRNVGATQSGGVGRPVGAGLDAMYVPLRLAPGYDINKLEEGKAVKPNTILVRRKPLAIRGVAGSGKTTWMRWTFRRLLEEPTAVPVMIELRRLVREWGQPGKTRSIEDYIEDWAAEHLGAGFRSGISAVLRQEKGPRPVLLVDGWDELGDLGVEFREKTGGVHEDTPARPGRCIEPAVR